MLQFLEVGETEDNCNIVHGHGSLSEDILKELLTVRFLKGDRCQECNIG